MADEYVWSLNQAVKAGYDETVKVTCTNKVTNGFSKEATFTLKQADKCQATLQNDKVLEGKATEYDYEATLPKYATGITTDTEGDCPIKKCDLLKDDKGYVEDDNSGAGVEFSKGGKVNMGLDLKLILNSGFADRYTYKFKIRCNNHAYGTSTVGESITTGEITIKQDHPCKAAL